MDLNLKDYDAALSALSVRARAKPGVTLTDPVYRGHIELDEVNYELEMDLVARCESLDVPSFPSGWRFRMLARAEARLKVVGASEQVKAIGDASLDAVTDPHGKMQVFPRLSEGKSEMALTRAWTDIQDRPGFASWCKVQATSLAEANQDDASAQGVSRSSTSR